jgi:hypothetical protein
MTGTEVIGSATQGYIWPIIHDYIIPGCQDQFVDNTWLLDLIKSSSKGVSGRQILFKNKMWRNRNARSFKERGPLPQAKSRGFKELSQTLRYVSVQVDFSGQELRLTKDKEQFIDLIADGFEDAMKGAQEEVNFMMWNDGSGRRAQVNGAITSDGTNSTVTFDGGSPLWFFPRMSITFGTTATEYEIISVPTATTFVVDGLACYNAYVAGTIANDDWIYNAGSYDADNAQDPWGLKIHVADDNGVHSLYQGIDRTAAGNEAFKAYINGSGSSTALTTLLMMQHVRAHKLRAGEYPDTVIADPPSHGSFVLLLEDKGTGPAEFIVSKTGFSKDIKFVYAGQEMLLRVADDCWANSMYFLTKKYIEIREGHKLQWDMEGGGKLIRDRDTDTYWGRMLWYFNTICTNNRAQSKLGGIKADAIS